MVLTKCQTCPIYPGLPPTFPYTSTSDIQQQQHYANVSAAIFFKLPTQQKVNFRALLSQIPEKWKEIAMENTVNTTRASGDNVLPYRGARGEQQHVAAAFLCVRA